jgi:lipopolysaccharide transport system ATP-binding protein
MIVAEVNNISLHVPVYSYNAFSIKKKILHLLNRDKSSPVLGSKLILNNVNFKIFNGDRIGVIGANGAGKTSLLKTISKIYYPTEGSVKLNLAVTSILDISLGIYGEATGIENIYIRGMFLGLNKNAIDKRLQEIIEISGLNNMINQPVYSYSSGMSMRLAFAVSMILEPELLILDEWLAVGDYQFQLTVKNKLNSFIKKTKALLFASHSLDQIKDICNRAIYMKKGEIIFDGSPEDAIKLYTSDTNK